MRTELFQHWTTGIMGDDRVLELLVLYHNKEFRMFSVSLLNFGVRVWY